MPWDYARPAEIAKESLILVETTLLCAGTTPREKVETWLLSFSFR